MNTSIIEKAIGYGKVLADMTPQIIALHDKFQEVMAENPRDPQKILEALATPSKYTLDTLDKYREDNGLSLQDIAKINEYFSCEASVENEELKALIKANLSVKEKYETGDFAALIGEAMQILIEAELMDEFMEKSGVGKAMQEAKGAFEESLEG